MLIARVFIASSKRAKPLAIRLRTLLANQEMEPNLTIKVDAWWDDTFQAGDQTLAALMQECRDCDFAVVLLTRDDVYKGEKDEDKIKARDNCVFEAGLFTGALEPKRCILLVSVDSKNLPTDLQGITYIPLAECPNDEEQKDALLSAAEKIVELVKKRKAYLNRPRLPWVSSSALLTAEKPVGMGGMLTDPYSVIVSSSRPVERSNQFAKWVIENLRAGCKYRYFFEDDEDNLEIIADLIQVLAAVDLDATEQIEREPKMQEKPEVVKKNLDDMRKRLRICFIKRQLFYCCIHNASNKDAAICYLRYDTKESKGFVKWFEKEAQSPDNLAWDMSKKLVTLYRRGKTPLQKGIFRSTSEFDLFSEDHKEFRENLENELSYRFPEILRDAMKEACFGNQAQQGAPAA